jgi:hypothetical protein
MDTISFRGDDMLNALVVEKSGRPIYDIRTSRRLFGLSMTTLREIDAIHGPSHILTQIDWRNRRVNIANTDRKWMAFEDLIPARNVWSQLVTAPHF